MKTWKHPTEKIICREDGAISIYRRHPKKYTEFYFPNKTPTGYVKICSTINTEKKISVHRLILEASLGRVLSVKDIIDHIDGNPSNNNIDNLRISSYEENAKNNKRFRSTGIPSLIYESKNGFTAKSGSSRKKERITLGIYSTIDKALEAQTIYKKTGKLTPSDLLIGNELKTGEFCSKGIHFKNSNYVVWDIITKRNNPKYIGAYNTLELAEKALKLFNETKEILKIKTEKELLGLPKGINLNKKLNKYMVRDYSKTPPKYLGVFTSLSEAIEVLHKSL